MLKQRLEQKLQQKLSPAQIQVIKMLEIPTLEMEERIQQELEENPALEEGCDDTSISEEDQDSLSNDEEYKDEEFNFEDYMDNDDDLIPDYKLHTSNISPDDKYMDIPYSEGVSFHEYLLEQAGLLKLDEKQLKVVEYIIGNIDDEGYLRRSAEMMADDLVFQAGIEVGDDDVKELITKVQQFEPAGIAAQDLKECLLLQLNRKPQSEIINTSIVIIEKYFQEFSKKHYQKILRSMNIDEETLKEVINEITKLNPKPGKTIGDNFIENALSVIIPDFIVDNENGLLSVRLNNSNIPELRINKEYSKMFEDFSKNKENQSNKMKNSLFFIKQKIDSARWFIDAIKQRQETLLKTMIAIVDVQKEFFIEGDEMFLKPMVLKDVADITGLDVSTISRVSNSKYVQTEYGVFPVKYFFSEKMITEDGEVVSTREIKSVLMDIIANEDKSNPINDDVLVEELKKKGYVIARRTAAKYREQLNIPVARLRIEM